jgi:hypothetical protein
MLEAKSLTIMRIDDLDVYYCQTARVRRCSLSVWDPARSRYFTRSRPAAAGTQTLIGRLFVFGATARNRIRIASHLNVYQTKPGASVSATV